VVTAFDKKVDASPARQDGVATGKSGAVHSPGNGLQTLVIAQGAEIVLGSLAMEIFGALVFSSVIATLTVRGFLGGNPLYDIPSFRLNGNPKRRAVISCHV